MTEPTVDVAIRSEGSAYRCGWTTDGRAWQAAGCQHETPREAVDHTEILLAGERPVIRAGEADR